MGEPPADTKDRPCRSVLALQIVPMVAVDVAGLAVKRDPPAYTDSEREAKRDLYQSRLVRLSRHATQIGLRGRGDLRVGHSELGSVEQVERLGAKRQIQPTQGLKSACRERSAAGPR